MQLNAIVVATDLSPAAAPAARWAQALAERTDAKVIAGHVFELGFDSWWRSKYEAAMNATRRAEALATIAGWYQHAVGQPAAVAELRVDHCAEGLSDIVTEHDADLLVMSPSHKSRLVKAVVGSRVHEIVARPPCAVAVIKTEDALVEGARVAVGTDFSPPSERAIRFAAGLARVTGRPLEVVTVAHQPKSPALPDLFDQVVDDLSAAIKARLQTFVAEILGPDHDAQLKVLDGDAVPATLYDYAESADLAALVVGRTGHRTIVADLMGSVPRSLINRMPCSIVVTPSS